MNIEDRVAVYTAISRQAAVPTIVAACTMLSLLAGVLPDPILGGPYEFSTRGDSVAVKRVEPDLLVGASRRSKAVRSHGLCS